MTRLFILVGMLLSASAFAGTIAAEKAAEFELNLASPGAMQKHALGTRVVRGEVRTAVARYDFSKSGGAMTAIALLGENGKAVILPKGALVTGCFIDVITAPTSGGSATISLGTGASATNLKAATAIASYTGIVACVPVGTAATSIKLAVDQTPLATVATATLLSGKFNVIIQYTISD